MKVYICYEFSEEHLDIKNVYDSEEKALAWMKGKPDRSPIHEGWDVFEVE